MPQISLKQEVTWYEITGKFADKRPEMDLEVLVFDGYLNDTVKASLSLDDKNQPVWLEQVTDQPLRDPQYWMNVPFPGDEK